MSRARSGWQHGGGGGVAKRTRSALKRQRQAIRRTARNQAVRTRVRTLVRKARASGSPLSADARAAARALDAAGRKGILHRNTAARRKSRLMRHLAAAQTAAPAPG
jgi:small subunit ribosomal protein S20